MSTKAQLQEIYIGLLGRAADPAGLQYWADEVDNGVLTIAEVRENIVNDQPEYEEMYEGKNREEVVSQLYLNLFGRPAEAAGLEYWVEGEGAEVTIDDLIFALSNGAGTSDRQTLDNRVEVAQYYSDNAAAFDKAESADLIADVDANPATVEDAKNAIDGGEQPSVPGDTFVLTEGRDVVTGTDNDDLFVGLVGQNQNGAISNALSTGDMLDGGAGRDRIEATMLNDNETDAFDFGQAPRPITSNIEEVSIEALENVDLDATRMEGVEEFWSDFSRGDLQIDNVNLRGSNVNNTNDITFGLKDAQGGARGEVGAGLEAYFESQALVRPDSSQINSQLLIRIADVSTETPDTPLANVSVNLGFSLGGVAYELEDVRSVDGTYAGLVNAIKNALVAEGLPGVSVELSTPYEEVTFAGNTVTLPFIAQEILLTDPVGNAFEGVNFTQSAIQPVQGGFLVAGNAAPVDPSVVGALIETNLVLDNAGRGSVAGHVEIGGDSNSGLGIEKFNVTVDRDSAIASLTTTTGFTPATANGHLQEIEIASAADANGSLYIGATQAGLREIDANGFAGTSLQLGGSKALHAGSFIQDLAFLDAGNTTANVTFVGENIAGLGDQSNSIVVNTGSGNDIINVAFSGSNSGSAGSAIRATINAGDGDNTVSVSSGGGAIFDPVAPGTGTLASITTGSGADVIRGGDVYTNISAGAGNDVIYADNTGLSNIVPVLGDVGTIAQLNAGVVSGLPANDLDIDGHDVNGTELLYGRQVQVTLGLPGMNPAVQFEEGLEVVADIVPANGGYLTTERDLYEAVARAINTDPVLNKLAVASVTSANNLVVTYLIDGESTLGDGIVAIDILGEWDDLSTAQQNNVVSALEAKYRDSEISDTAVETAYDGIDTEATVDVTLAGENAVTAATNTINAGTGDDVIVLNSSADADAIDTLEFDAGQFGNDTIVHFSDGAGGDILDFTAWLDNVRSTSGSAESQVRIDGNLNTSAGAIDANDVTVVDFATLAPMITATNVTFASMTDAQVLAALKQTGGFTVGTPDAELVGGVQKSLLIVQNVGNTVATAQDNEGEYKVFQVTSTGTGTEDFGSVTLVGSLDFGAEQTFAVENFIGLL